MSKNQNLKNKFLTYKLVKDYFCLEEKSLKLFKYRLFQEQFINKEYKKIIGNASDLRMRIDVDDSFYERFDKGWTIFRDIFYNFVSCNGVHYEDYLKNMISYKKQRYKTKKALVDFYCENVMDAYNDLRFENYISSEFHEAFPEITSHHILTPSLDYDFEECLTFTDVDVNNRSIIKISTKEIKEKGNLLEKEIEKVIMSKLAFIGTQKIPNKKLQLVLSLNFADWFLCSSAESWTSCINFESDFRGAYWHGLPGLIGDKNRAIMYITDGTKKNYRGIEVDKMLCRSWILTTRTKRKTDFLFVGSYPVDMGMRRMADKYFGMDFTINEKFIGRYYIEFLYHKTNILNILHQSYIYQDRTMVKVANKNKTKYFPNQYGYIVSNGSDYIPLILDKKKGKTFYNEEYGFNVYHGLRNLRKNKLENTYSCEGEICNEDDANIYNNIVNNEVSIVWRSATTATATINFDLGNVVRNEVQEEGVG